jgi:hypothetical protein
VEIVKSNWESRDILLGECKWGTDRVDRQIARELIENKTPLTLRDLPDDGHGWRVHYALFARSGFTPAAAAEMNQHQGLQVDLIALDEVLGREAV